MRFEMKVFIRQQGEMCTVNTDCIVVSFINKFKDVPSSCSIKSHYEYWKFGFQTNCLVGPMLLIKTKSRLV